MPRTTPTTQKVARSGLAASYTAPDVTGDVIDAGNTVLHIKNGSASPVTVTVDATATVEGLALTDLTVTVPAAGDRFIGPFPRSIFGQPAGSATAGKVHVNYSAVTSVTRAVLSV